MNNYQNTSSGAGILKNVYPVKGPVAQMHDKHPMINAIRKKRDALRGG